jgi:cytoskeletal protein RodZ
LLGEILKKSREGAGLDLHEVAHTLRIQYEYLRALENDNLEKLPPDVYVKAYIREYARFLNIDAGPLLDEYMTLTMKNGEEARPLPPPASKKSPLPRIALSISLAIAVILVFFIYVFVYDRKTVVPVAPVTPSVSGHADSMPAASSSAVPSASDQTKAVRSAHEPEHILDVTAAETTWLRVELAEGESEEVLLRPGETRKWTSKSGFNLKIGNAGGVRLVLDNRDVGVPGEKGRVVKLRLPEESR